MKVIKSSMVGFDKFFMNLRKRGKALSPPLLTAVARILRDVENKGDEALFQYTARFDGYRVTASSVEVKPAEKKKALALVAPRDLQVLKQAAKRIAQYHRYQTAHGFSLRQEKGIALGQRLLPLKQVGIYAPGGKASYPSTILMASIPARLAGVGEIILVTPCREGRLDPIIAAAAEIGGVSRIFKVGGAQAIAALAYGTRTIPRVDKIVGPGNAYVAAAKKLVFGQVDIDMIAGPSEVVIIADRTAKASFVAADLLAQLEHDEMAAAILLTSSEKLARDVAEEVRCQQNALSRKKIVEKSLRRYGAIIVTRGLREALTLADRFAPEHLELMIRNPLKVLNKIQNAGSVFCGAFTPEVLGDYMAGTNHILPTGGTARFSSPLGVYSFYKRMSILSFTQKAMTALSRQTARFAAMEGLDAHQKSILIRTE